MNKVRRDYWRQICSKGGVKMLAFSIAACLLSSSVRAQWVISANETKIDLTSGKPKALPDATEPDSLTFLDFSVFPPKVEHLLNLPNSVIGPPSHVAISGGQSSKA